ncbi:MAG: hypothetical protein CM15mP88_1360 [Pseudomonadota bacterium]|nr:MAG: hypothetical protein CM15mP88_1360 [Pseudomonadota bacterium]
MCANTIPVCVAASPAFAIKKNIATPEIINGTIIGDIKVAMINPLYGICLLLTKRSYSSKKNRSQCSKYCNYKTIFAARPHGFFVP